ncbi:MAG: DnaJ domain-containing protein [Archangiaceae bacterium]|nr:DnaJ domain-containing protein [Archangiaceae bacterium]
MAPPVLLVADDLSTIASVKRVLGREGYEVILATSAADAVIAWGHHLPGLVILQPTVESERGSVVLEELQQHPDAQLLHVVLLGESIPGFGYHVEPLPIDPEHFAKTVQSQMRASEDGQDWTVSEPPTETTPLRDPPKLDEPEPWRATRPPSATPSDEHPQTQELIEDAAPTPPDPPTADHEQPPFEASPSTMTRLFGDLPSLEDELHRDVEAQAMASVESSLQQLPTEDDELQRLEDEVRAEAARRRAAREAQAAQPAFTPPPVQPLNEPVEPPEPTVDTERFTDSSSSDETSFADVTTTPPDGAADPTSVPMEPEAPTSVMPTPVDSATAREVLARAEAITHESRAISQSQRQAADAERRRAESELEALKRRAEHAEQLVRREREARAAVEDQVEELREEVKTLASQLESERHESQARFASDLEAVSAQAEERRAAQETELTTRLNALAEAHADREATVSAQLSELEAEVARRDEVIAEHETKAAAFTKQLDSLERQLDVTNATAVERAAERESLLASLTHEQDAARKAESRAAKLEGEKASLQNDLKEVRAQLELAAGRVKELTTQLDDERLARMEVEEKRDELSGKLEKAVAQAVEARGEAEAALKLASEVEGALSVTKGELESTRTDLDETRQKLEDAARALATVTGERPALLARLETLEREREQLLDAAKAQDERIGELESQLEGDRTHAAALSTDVASHKEALETQRARADEADALAQLTTERLKAMEHRQVMNLALPGRRALGLPRNGTVSLGELATLVSTLVAAQADVRLELGVRGGTRTLWFKKGALHGAESSFDHESLIDRARRDGLIDARQEAELRLLRTATAQEQLEAMKARGYLREIETIPLLQRATEAVALEAFSEETTQYRLSDEPPSIQVLLVAVPRSTLPLLAEALRRAVPTDVVLETLGGAEAVCVATENDVDLRAMGFTDKERKMLSWVDGEASVEDLTLAAGLKQEHAFRALLVAKLLGVIEVKPPEKPAPVVSGDLDIRRLEAKYDEVQEADYFSILGLSRSASSDDVQRAFRRLAEEFDPIKYTGHPDASLQQRAQVVSTLIEEAARALEDERRRAEYARHLLD